MRVVIAALIATMTVVGEHFVAHQPWTFGTGATVGTSYLVLNHLWARRGGGPTRSTRHRTKWADGLHVTTPALLAMMVVATQRATPFPMLQLLHEEAEGTGEAIVY
jgi:hypothetical protein